MTELIEELLKESEQEENKLQLAHVDLMLSEMKSIQQQIDSNFLQAEEEKKIIDNWVIAKNLKLQEKVERITNQLEIFMNMNPDVKTVDLPNGKLLKRKQPDKIEIVDMDQFLSEANSQMLVIQPEIVRPDLNKIKAFYKRTLKVPEGTKLVIGKEKFSIKLKQNGEENNGKEEIRTGVKQTNSFRDAV